MDPRFEELFGIGLKTLREHYGLSQDEMAKTLGLGGRQAISAYESGIRFPDGPVRVTLTSWCRSIGAPLGGMPGITYISEVGRAVHEHRRPNLPPLPPAPGADSTSGVVSVVEVHGAPGRTEATRGDDGEPAPATQNPCASSPACRVRAIPEVP